MCRPSRAWDDGGIHHPTDKSVGYDGMSLRDERTRNLRNVLLATRFFPCVCPNSHQGRGSDTHRGKEPPDAYTQYDNSRAV